MTDGYDHLTAVPEGYWYDEAEASRAVTFFEG